MTERWMQEFMQWFKGYNKYMKGTDIFD